MRVFSYICNVYACVCTERHEFANSQAVAHATILCLGEIFIAQVDFFLGQPSLSRHSCGCRCTNHSYRSNRKAQWRDRVLTDPGRRAATLPPLDLLQPLSVQISEKKRKEKERFASLQDDRRYFYKLVSRSLVQSIASAILAPSLQFLTEKAALLWRERLTKRMHRRYLKKFAFSHVKQVWIACTLFFPLDL